jgi:hypothetical protein
MLIGSFTTTVQSRTFLYSELLVVAATSLRFIAQYLPKPIQNKLKESLFKSKVRNDCTKQQTTLNTYFHFTGKIKSEGCSQPQVQNHCPDNWNKFGSTSLPLPFQRNAERR